MNKKEIKNLIDKFYEAKTSINEEKALFDFFKRDDIPEDLSMHRHHFEMLHFFKGKRVSENFEENFEKRRNANRNYSWTIMGVAATVTLLVLGAAVYFFLPFSKNNTASMSQMVSAENKVRIFNLADGTKVWLNAGSKLQYPPIFTGPEREVVLEGEGFFEVAKDPVHPFIIRTTKTITKVLGTSFNLKENKEDDQVELTVITGKVAFSDQQDSNLAEVTAGKGAVFNNNKNLITKTDYADVNLLAWKTHKLVFNDLPLKEVIKVLKKYFNSDIEIVDSNLGECRFKGSFSEAKLEEVFQVIHYSMGISSAKKNNRYLLSGNGCK